MSNIRTIFSAVVMLSIAAVPAKAGYFNTLVNEINPDQEFISLPVYNDTTRNNMYTVAAYKIAKPGQDDEKRVIDAEKEIIYSPLKFNTQPKAKEYFKIYYRGPRDNIERYYRIVFKETPILLFPMRADNTALDVIPVVALSTYLVVRPRKVDLKYEIDELNGIIKNTGNTYFRVIIQKGCEGDDESSTQFYMLPGERWQDSKAKSGNKKYIVAMGRYHALGNSCPPPKEP